MNYEILVNYENPIDIEYLNNIVVPNLEEVSFSRDNDWEVIYPLEDWSEKEETKYIHSILSEFGFILRFPKEKISITKMQYEPWHIRYVGLELAKKLTEEDRTLEEYYMELGAFGNKK